MAYIIDSFKALEDKQFYLKLRKVFLSIRFGKTVPSFFGEVVSTFWSHYAILM